MRLALCLVMVAMSLGADASAEELSLQPTIDKGLAALVKLQQPDGLLGEGAGISALAGMALLAGGLLRANRRKQALAA